MNTKHTKTAIAALTLAAFLFAASACAPSDNGETATETTDAPIHSLLLSETPAEALSVLEARSKAKPGERIQVSGQIGGTVQPFVEGYAGFVLADPEIQFCDEMGDDEHCSTPWDACCEDPDKLQSMRIAVQFVDGEGFPIQTDLKQSIGLKELDQVIITGTVANSSTADNVIIDATGVYKL